MFLDFLKRYYLKRKLRNINTRIETRHFSNDLLIGKNCIIGKLAYLSNNVRIGDFTYINSSHLQTIIESNVNIGSFCSIGPGVIIGMGNHYINTVTTHPILFNEYYRNVFNKGGISPRLDGLIDKDKETVIGSDVWIGARANIKRGIKVGDGAIIAAESVVTKDVPKYAIVGGVPAKLIKYRFPEEKVDFLLKNDDKCFWNWSEEMWLKNYNQLYNIDDYIDVINNF